MAFENVWRMEILDKLHARNKRETCLFNDIIVLQNRNFDQVNRLQNENIQLTLQNERLRLSCKDGSGGNSERIQQLEQKLLAQAEELTDLHRRKGENSQQIIDLNKKLIEKENIIASQELRIKEQSEMKTSLRAEIELIGRNKQELESLNQILRDEHQALQIAYTSLEEKLRKVQNENRQLLETIMHYKEKDADKMNEENENFVNEVASSTTAFFSRTLDLFGKKQQRVQRELEEASWDTTGSPEIQEGVGPLFTSALPSQITLKFDAHDGEVNAVKWSPVDRMIATGGADRKLKLWDVSKNGSYECKGILVGSNAAVMSVDFDSTGALILGASNDFASRVWTVADQRLRHTLTGHSGKVMAARFLGEPTKVVTGSHDRTLKLWDLRSKACVETKFAGSSCNDLVTSDSRGSTIISGHFDKTIRFWDLRAEKGSDDILLQGKVTSLDLSRDANYLLSCVRDDTLKLLDLRMNQIVSSFSCEGFKVSCDWARAAFSPDGQYISVGSADGSIYIWNVLNSKVEKVLKDQSSAVTAVSWHTYGTFLASVDKSKRAVIWGDC